MHRVVEEIASTNTWRDGEFAKFKVNAADVDEELWCRMCIPMIYAHWEGYVVTSLKILIHHLNDLKLEPKDVPTNLVVVGLGDTYRTLSGKQSFKQRIEFTDRFSGLYQKSLKFTKKINTRSNLKSDVLEELCDMFLFKFNNFSEYTGDIDRLVNIRNSIAHGENSIVPNMKNVEKYIEAVTNAMDVLLSEIQTFLDNEDYLLQKSA